MRKWMALGVVVCLAVGIGFASLAPGGKERRWREEELSYLRTALPEDLLQFAHLDVSSLEALAITGAGEGRCLGLRVFPGLARVRGGMRAEVSVDFPYAGGDTVRYASSLMIPEVFLDEEPKPRITARGPNMNNGYQHYWKLGQYRHPDIATDNWIYVDALSGAHITPPPNRRSGVPEQSMTQINVANGLVPHHNFIAISFYAS